MNTNISDDVIDKMIDNDLLLDTIEIINNWKGHERNVLYAISDYHLIKSREYTKKVGNRIVTDKATAQKNFDMVDKQRQIVTFDIFKTQKNDIVTSQIRQLYPDKKVLHANSEHEYRQLIEKYKK